MNDELWVAQGTYDEGQSLQPPIGVDMYGGFNATETSRDQRDPTLYDTILTSRLDKDKGCEVPARINGFEMTSQEGIYISNCSQFEISNNTILGMIFMAGNSAPSILGNVIKGGLIVGQKAAPATSPLIANNLITGSPQTGAALMIVGGSPVIVNNTIVDASIGIYLFLSVGSPVIHNNLVAFNSQGIVAGNTSVTPVLGHNAVFGNGTNYQTVLPGSTDLSVDPEFMNRSGGDYHLSLTSPLIDAGDDVRLSGEVDLDGQSRLAGAHVDIGAYEYSPSAPPVVLVHPADVRVAVGQTINFNVSASGTKPFRYQWQKGGIDISQATLSIYTTPPTTFADQGATFRCVVSNSQGSVISRSAALTVTSASSGQPNNATETKFGLFKNIFNPIKESILTIKYISPGEDARLTVYDRQGDEIKTLERGSKSNGEYSTTWDGRNNSGSVVAAGTYVLVLKQGGVVLKKKVVVVK